MSILRSTISDARSHNTTVGSTDGAASLNGRMKHVLSADHQSPRDSLPDDRVETKSMREDSRDENTGDSDSRDSHDLEKKGRQTGQDKYYSAAISSEPVFDSKKTGNQESGQETQKPDASLTSIKHVPTAVMTDDIVHLLHPFEGDADHDDRVDILPSKINTPTLNHENENSIIASSESGHRTEPDSSELLSVLSDASDQKKSVITTQDDPNEVRAVDNRIPASDTPETSLSNEINDHEEVEKVLGDIDHDHLGLPVADNKITENNSDSQKHTRLRENLTEKDIVKSDAFVLMQHEIAAVQKVSSDMKDALVLSDVVNKVPMPEVGKTPVKESSSSEQTENLRSVPAIVIQTDAMKNASDKFNSIPSQKHPIKTKEAPTVQIGQIDVIIETVAQPVQRKISSPSSSDLASRHYLRRL